MKATAESVTRKAATWIASNEISAFFIKIKELPQMILRIRSVIQEYKLTSVELFAFKYFVSYFP